MDLAKLDRQILWATITLASIDIGMVVAALTEQTYYDTLKTPIFSLTIITLACCLIGYLVNQKYLKSPN